MLFTKKSKKGRGGWEFQDERSANPRSGTSDRGWQGAGATLVALVAATPTNIFWLRIPQTKHYFLSLDTIEKI